MLVKLQIIRSYSTINMRDNDSSKISAIVASSLDYPSPTINHNKDMSYFFYPSQISE